MVNKVVYKFSMGSTHHPVLQGGFVSHSTRTRTHGTIYVKSCTYRSSCQPMQFFSRNLWLGGTFKPVKYCIGD